MRARVGIPWGISESGNAHRNEAGDYGYLAYGIPHIALFYEATAGPVVSPYSSFLALGVDSVEAISNLRHMASLGWVGAYGYYEASDYTTEASERRTGARVDGAPPGHVTAGRRQYHLRRYRPAVVPRQSPGTVDGIAAP